MLYYRRKILLALLQIFDGQLTAKQLQKYLFLFTREQTEKSFDFIPYYYGCFSFQANQDVCTLNKYGYVSFTESKIELKHDSNFVSELDMFDQAYLKMIREKYGHLTQDELIKYTYEKYPYYAINSKIAEQLLSDEYLETIKKQRRKFSEPQLFSIGYEGISLEKYINYLIIQDVHVLCDVRKNAYSQKYGFSKVQLQKACEGVGIEYVHIPELGIESDSRRNLNSQKDYDLLFDEYEKTTLKSNENAILRVIQIIQEKKRIALTCFEKNPRQCHRTRVANEILSRLNIPFLLLNK